MASYVRETVDRTDALPAIRRTQAWDSVSPVGSRRVILDPDPLLVGDRNVRYHTSTSSYRVDDPVRIPRPPSPGARDQSRRHVIDVSIVLSMG